MSRRRTLTVPSRGRPLVVKRHGHWFVLTVEDGVVAGYVRDLGRACDTARFWSVMWHGLHAEGVAR